MARINSLDSIEFFGFEEGQSLPGAMAEAAAFLRSNHPDVPELDLSKARIDKRGDTFYVVLPYRDKIGGG